MEAPWLASRDASFAQRADSLAASDIAGASPRTAYVRRRVPAAHSTPERCAAAHEHGSPRGAASQVTSRAELSDLVRKHKVESSAAGSWQQKIEGSSPRQARILHYHLARPLTALTFCRCHA